MVNTGVRRAPSWVRAARAVVVGVALVVGTVLGPAQFVQAHPGDKHRAEPHPHVSSGGGFVNSSSYEAGSYAFAVRRGGIPYVVTAQHVAPSGAAVYGPEGLLGNTSIVSESRDTSYVRLASGEANDRVQIATSESGAAIRATIDSVATRGSIAVGQRVCHSGYADSTQEAGGFVCGDVVDVPSACTSFRADTACQITMRSDGGQAVGWQGDSGGPVWQQVAPGRVRLLGVFTAVSSPDGGPPSLGHFVPAFDVLDDLGGVPVSASS